MTPAEQLDLCLKALYAIRDQLNQEPGSQEVRTALLIAQTTAALVEAWTDR